MSRKKINTALLTILGLLLAALFLSPFYVIIINAFKTQRDFFTDVLALPHYLYLENFKQAIHDTKYFKTIGNTVFVTSGSLVLIIITASMAAWRLTRTYDRKISKAIYFMRSAGAYEQAGHVVHLYGIRRQYGDVPDQFLCEWDSEGDRGSGDY